MTADGIQIAGEGEDGSSATYYLGGCMPGCTDAEACNYDDMANDDGSCLELDVCGDCGGTGYAACIDPEADNYDEGACVDDGSCIATSAALTLKLTTTTHRRTRILSQLNQV